MSAHQSMTEIIGVDLGGTKLHVGRTQQGKVLSESRHIYNSKASETDVVNDLISAINSHMSKTVIGIGIGVPSIVDTQNGIVYETINIPSWREVHLQKMLEDRFQLPVRINNDVNCFVVGEHKYGVAHGHRNVVGLCLGTGMGVGLIINNQLYHGNNCGAGELGALKYRDGSLEDYCSGNFFQQFHNTTGQTLCENAERGDAAAKDVLNQFGAHVAAALSTVLLAYDPEVVVLGGSVARAYPFFAENLQIEMETFPFQKIWGKSKLLISNNPSSAVLGAAYLIAK